MQNEDCYVHTEHTYYWMSAPAHHYQTKAWVEKGSFFVMGNITIENKREDSPTKPIITEE